MPRRAVTFVLTKVTKSNKKEPFRLGSLLTLSRTTKGSAAFGICVCQSLFLTQIMYALVFMLIIRIVSERRNKRLLLDGKLGLSKKSALPLSSKGQIQFVNTVKHRMIKSYGVFISIYLSISFAASLIFVAMSSAAEVSFATAVT